MRTYKFPLKHQQQQEHKSSEGLLHNFVELNLTRDESWYSGLQKPLDPSSGGNNGNNITLFNGVGPNACSFFRADECRRTNACWMKACNPKACLSKCLWDKCLQPTACVNISCDHLLAGFTTVQLLVLKWLVGQILVLYSSLQLKAGKCLGTFACTYKAYFKNRTIAITGRLKVYK